MSYRDIASKAGVKRLTEALAEELKDRNIAVDCVLPGIMTLHRIERRCPMLPRHSL
jgi:short-subunit dehydrogenase